VLSPGRRATWHTWHNTPTTPTPTTHGRTVSWINLCTALCLGLCFGLSTGECLPDTKHAGVMKTRPGQCQPTCHERSLLRPSHRTIPTDGRIRDSQSWRGSIEPLANKDRFARTRRNLLQIQSSNFIRKPLGQVSLGKVVPGRRTLRDHLAALCTQRRAAHSRVNDMGPHNAPQHPTTGATRLTWRRRLMVRERRDGRASPRCCVITRPIEVSPFMRPLNYRMHVDGEQRLCWLTCLDKEGSHEGARHGGSDAITNTWPSLRPTYCKHDALGSPS